MDLVEDQHRDAVELLFELVIAPRHGTTVARRPPHIVTACRSPLQARASHDRPLPLDSKILGHFEDASADQNCQPSCLFQDFHANQLAT